MRFTRSESSLLVKVLRNTVLVLFLIIFVSIVYNFRNNESATETALIAEAKASVEFRGVFIRDEQPVTYTGKGVLSYNVEDGGKVGSGSLIASVYADESQIDRNREIKKLEKELDILEKIQNPGTRESAQPSDLAASIEENYRSLMLSRDMNDKAALMNTMDTLLVQMSTYQIITNEVEDFSAQINDINMRLDQLKQEHVEPTEQKKSDRSAYFISYCDGYEDKLSSANLDTITADQLEEVEDKRTEDNTLVGKLVDGYCWYLAGVVDNSRKEYVIGSRVKLRLESSTEIYDVTIHDVRDDGDPSHSVIILSGTRFGSDIVQHRTENVELILGNFRGLRVPREAIRFVTLKDDNTEDSTDSEVPASTEASTPWKGVYIKKGEQPEFKKIDVIYEGSDYVLSEIHEEDTSYLQLYDDIMIEGVD